ncbi:MULTISPECIES: transcription initiation factor IIB [Metallosphaera]|uniref:Transcription initiation factor IIB n=3 Tax=Metallosphaera TaxID=41980 RepID=A4YHI6_METS5|nr:MULTISPECIES: transcription initiation factor IIB family protein [Metallosphaera]ABP95888.1 Transcription initiation factor IIB (TFIIB) [Metallosphaera sedula DSM 5348]AIM27872.1 Transcription initiation factor IIB (TFIIB) [Metallosphaera sedula]AKV74712.1 transcription initiation factor IIB 2 [Metallosphaera sedula]AKV76950.1 transcription initiation factor IIB 2 [Metallosphaera sedula]AKV79201.1 transcription initiation factor IIB 2 [Metallosphaera sedula]
MKCPICEGTEIIYDAEHGNYVCARDGTVIEENVPDPGPEWREFDAGDRNKKRRVGAGITDRVHDKGFSTIIGGGRVKDKMKAIRLQRLQNKSRVTSKDKKLVTYLSILNSEASKLGLPGYVKETAAGVIKKLIESGLARRIDTYALIAATLFYVSRLYKIPLQLNEIKKLFNIDSSAFWKASTRVQNVIQKSTFMSNFGGPSPLEHIPDIVNRAKLPPHVETMAAEIASILIKNAITSGKGHLSVAAAAVYLASTILDHKKTQKELAEVLNITEVTIRNRYKEIVNSLDVEVKL